MKFTWHEPKRAGNLHEHTQVLIAETQALRRCDLLYIG